LGLEIVRALAALAPLALRAPLAERRLPGLVRVVELPGLLLGLAQAVEGEHLVGLLLDRLLERGDRARQIARDVRRLPLHHELHVRADTRLVRGIVANALRRVGDGHDGDEAHRGGDGGGEQRARAHGARLAEARREGRGKAWAHLRPGMPWNAPGMPCPAGWGTARRRGRARRPPPAPAPPHGPPGGAAPRPPTRPRGRAAPSPSSRRWCASCSSSRCVTSLSSTRSSRGCRRRLSPPSSRTETRRSP